MNKTEIMNRMSQTFNKVSFTLQKHSPEILVVAGVVGTVASAVIACRSTTKISGILDKAKKEVDTIQNCLKDETLSEEYTPEIARKDLAVVYIQTGVKLARLYAPAVALGVLSLGCILSSNDILRKRNAALAAAYATVDKSFKEYRSRVIDRFGKEIDHELKYNIKAKQFEETVVDENGNETTVVNTVHVANINGFSEYARFFDPSCDAWEKDSDYNLTFLTSQQRYANDKLQKHGRLFLNEVYDMLGIPRTKAGQVVGWVYDSKNPIGDNYIDFGIHNIKVENCRRFVNGYETTILLDFNVDGNIWDLM